MSGGRYPFTPAEVALMRYRAFADGEPCPVCGLSHEATAELITIRDTVRVSRANDEVKAIAEDALRRAGKAEAEVETLRRQIAGVRAALDRIERRRLSGAKDGGDL